MAPVWLLVGAAVGAVVCWLVMRRMGESGPLPDAVSPEPDTSDDGEEFAPESDRLRSVLDALAVGVVVGDAEGVTYRNSVAAGLTGALHADVLIDEAVEAHLAAAIDGHTRRQVLDLFGPPRTVVVVQATPLDHGALVTIEDITERSRLDAVRTDFVANVSHELKTPVGAIAVLAEALVDEEDPAIVRRFVSKMVHEAHRVGNTIDNLLELSRIELGGEAVRLSVDVPGVIASAIDRVHSLATDRRIRVVSDIDTDATVLGDSRQLVSALGNLVENAVKYSDENSVVTVAARVVDEMLELSVTDTGVGIPARDLDRVFERFYRVDRARSRETGGTGLGLSIVRHVATNHGGDVTVSSREGEGSTFTLRIPIVRAPRPIVTPQNQESPHQRPQDQETQP
jgi:two-component system sensor histidine kinase SenX3